MSKKICIICGEEFDGYGNNAQPLANGICCNRCNNAVVDERIKRIMKNDRRKNK